MFYICSIACFDRPGVAGAALFLDIVKSADEVRFVLEMTSAEDLITGLPEAPGRARPHPGSAFSDLPCHPPSARKKPTATPPDAYPMSTE